MKNYQRRTTILCEEMRQLFKNTVTLPECKLDGYKQKRQLLFTNIGIEWYINNIIENQLQFKNQD